MTDVFSDIQDLFLEALDDASTNFQKAEKNTITNDGVKMQIRNEYANEIDKWFKDGKPNEETFILGSTGDVLQGLGAIESDIYMLSDKINEILETHPEMTVDEIKKIPQILENPVLVLKSKNFGRNTKPNTRLVIFGSVKAKDGKPILSVLDLRPNEKNLIIEDMQKVTSAYTKDVKPVDFIKESIVLFADKSKTTKLLKSIGFKMPIELQKSGYIGSISYFNRSVNISGEKFSNIVVESNVKKSLRDSTGRKLSPEVAEYFKDSKARDKDGNLLVLYHQTDNFFTVFDTHRQGAGSADNETPYGIFLKSNDKDIGLKGKNQIPLYANITNPLVAENRQELVYKISQLSVEYLKLHNRRQEVDTEYSAKNEKARNELRDFITKWREQNKDADSRILYDSNEFNELFDAEDTILEEWTAKVEKVSAEGKKVLTEVLKENGYDGVILHNDIGSFGRNTDAYIALEPNQVKYIDNVSPTANDDIRFSERGQSVYKLLGENQRLQKENERLKEKVKYLNDFVKLQRKITHGKIIDRRSTEAQARKIKKSTGSKIELSNLTDQLYAFYTLIIGSEDLVWDTVFTRASWIANDILNEVPESNQRDEYAQEILSKNNTLSVKIRCYCLFIGFYAFFFVTVLITKSVPSISAIPIGSAITD